MTSGADVDTEPAADDAAAAPDDAENADGATAQPGDSEEPTDPDDVDEHELAMEKDDGHSSTISPQKPRRGPGTHRDSQSVEQGEQDAPEERDAVVDPADSAIDDAGVVAGPDRSVMIEQPMSVSAPQQPKPARPEASAATAAISTPDGILDTVTSALTDGPEGPVESPIAWALLAAARRQLGRTADEQGESLATIGGVNAAPTAILSRQSSPSAWTGRVTGSIRATDTDGDRLTYAGATTSKGAVTVSAWGTFTYIPTAAARHAAAAVTADPADKTDSFIITVSDGNGGIAEVTVTVPIRPANSAPSWLRSSVAEPDPISGVVTGRISASDSDDDSVTYTAATPKNGTVTVNPDGTFTYVAGEAARANARSTWYSDTDSFKITVDDGHGGVRTVTTRVKIAPTNTAPTAGTPRFTGYSASSGAITGAVNAIDPEGDSLTYSGSSTTPRGRLTVNSWGTFRYTPNAAARHAAAAGHPDDTTDTVVVVAKDKYGAVTAISLTIPILPRNVAPRPGRTTVGQPDSATGIVIGRVTATDADGDVLSFTGSTATGKGEVVVNGDGSFVYTPTPQARVAAGAAGADGSAKVDSFAVTVEDGYGGTTTIPVQVPIAPSVGNLPPQPGSSDMGAPDLITGAVAGNLGFVDPEGNSLSYVLVTEIDSATGIVELDAESGTWRFTPTLAARTSSWLSGGSAVQFTIAVSDGEATVNSTVTVPIDPRPVVADIPVGVRPFDMKLTPDGRHAIITFYGDAAVAVVDTETGDLMRVQIVGSNGVVLVDPSRSRAYVTTYIDGYGRYVTAIDPDTGAVAGGPFFLSNSSPGLDRIAITPDGRYIYTASDSWTVTVFDTVANTTVGGSPVVDHLNDVVVSGPIFYGFARNLLVSPDGSRVYVLGSATTMPPGPDQVFTIIGTDTRSIIANGGGAGPLDANAVYDRTVLSPDGQYIYTMLNTVVDGQWVTTITQVATDTNSIVATSAPVGTHIKEIAVTPDGRHVYVLTAEGVTVLNPILDMAIDEHIEIPGYGTQPFRGYDLIMSGDGQRLYVVQSGEGADPVTNGMTGSITVIDTSTNTITGSPIVVPTAQSVSLSPDGSRLYVLNYTDSAVGQGSLTTIDTGTSYVDPATIAPTSYAGLYQRLRQKTAYSTEGVHIETVLDDEGDEARVIVYLGGTTDDWFGTNQPRIDNLPAFVTRTVKEEQLDLIDAALARVPGAKVMLVGYSQGGMDAQNIAALGRYDVTSVVTFGSPIVQAGSAEYTTIHLWDPRDNVAQLTRSRYEDLYFDALDDHELFESTSRTTDQSWLIPFVDSGFWKVHGALGTYLDVGDAFENSPAGNSSHYWAVKNNVQQFLGQPLLSIPDGYVFVDGALIPIF
ncbi:MULTISPECIES: Ig-like domain-containing protein [Mycolicibacterium]|uniref:Ig-like domain-containing protein n=1 Tax=Mycolicibacterium TaxID=1866885 RepID=UPI001CA313DE|nr:MULTISPECIES: Ig-like domain-containing protein [Mycolicibacterium]QZT58407.1 tandem-95 repeat protein [Mycolicibacterium austroafricanum]